MTNPLLGPIGPLVADHAALRPQRITLHGAYVTVEPLDHAKHGDPLWQGTGGDANSDLWRYMHSGPFSDRAAFDAYLEPKPASLDPIFFALLDKTTGSAAGQAAYLRIDPGQRVIEVGFIVYAREFQKTRAATEAMYLMAKHAFEDLGYRRYEWKCNALNEGSQRAARRLGFAFEGIFRQHMVVKGRNRDTAWYAMVDSDWPARKQEFERWLAADNFDATGRQKSRLSHR